MLWFSPLFAFQEYIIAEKENKMLELDTLFMLVKVVLYEYVPKKWAKPYLQVFLRKPLNFRTKIERL